MGVNRINILDGLENPKKSDVDKASKAGDKSFQDALEQAIEVFEGAPAFAASVAKMNVDEMTAKSDSERKRGGELQELAEKHIREIKKVPPAQRP